MSELNSSDLPLFLDRNYIGGQWVRARQSASLDVDDPATGAVIGSVPDCGSTETREAVEVATGAFSPWRTLPSNQRAHFLDRWNDLILRNSSHLATIITSEQGKPLAEAEGEVRYAASFVKWFAEECRRTVGLCVPSSQSDRRILVTKEPVGVCAAITPWNFPAATVTRKCAAAMAAGCTVVLKPSELTPYTALALARLAEIAGIPPGVFNVITGRPAVVGGELTSNAAVRKVSFTGSTKVGTLLMRQSADTVKRLSLELGGNAPLIVFADADLDAAVLGTMVSKFRNAGQTCVCANRILVDKSVHDEFVARLCRTVNSLKVGNGRSPGTTIGPLINSSAVRKVREHIEDALTLGATIVLRNDSRLDPERYVDPVVLTGANSEMRLSQEETFGPVAPIFSFSDEAEAIELANATPYGLASYFFTQNVRRAWRVAERLEAGMVALNTGIVSMEVAPFGGVKLSGLGREGGTLGIEEYLQTKTFHIGGLDA